jgi:hypothetical protein
MTADPTRRGFSVRVFLPDGDPEGLKVVEKSNWSGRGLVIPRPVFSLAKTRDEFSRTGVYLLVGSAEGSPLPKVYIGEGDPVGPRLQQHAKSKEFWTHAVVFTSKDANLNKAHVQRLEARLVELARLSKRSVLDNANVPAPPSLSDADVAEVERYLDDLLLCVPILGYSFFEAPPSPARSTIELILAAKGVEASGYELPAGFVVRAGSCAVGDGSVVPSIHAYLRDLRLELIRQGVLRQVGEIYELTQDYTFSSPSTAAGVLLGRSAKGRLEWATRNGRTLKSIQDGEITE